MFLLQSLFYWSSGSLSGAAADIFFLPEKRLPATSVSADLREKFWTWKVLKRTFSGLAGLLMGLIFIMSFGMTNFQGIAGLYVVRRFSFTPRQVGLIWMVIGAVLILGQGVLSEYLIRLHGEKRVIQAGLLLGALGFVAMLIAGNFLIFMLTAGFFALSAALVGPALNSYMSSFGGENQGSLMGLNAAFASLGRVVGPLWAGFIFDIQMTCPFISGACTLLTGFLISLWVGRPSSSPTPIHDRSVQ